MVCADLIVPDIDSLLPLGFCTPIAKWFASMKSSGSPSVWEVHCSPWSSLLQGLGFTAVVDLDHAFAYITHHVVLECPLDFDRNDYNMASITDIPTELVRKIVKFADLPLRNLDALRQISRAFNHLILNDPLFWARLHFSELPPSMLGTLLARSGDVPLSVSIVIDNPLDYESVCNVLRDHMHRMLALDISVQCAVLPEEAAALRQLLASPAPLLKRARLDHQSYSWGRASMPNGDVATYMMPFFEITEQLFAASAPNLNELVLTGQLLITNEDHKVFHQLTSFTVDSNVLGSLVFDSQGVLNSFCSVQRLELLRVGRLDHVLDPLKGLVAPLQALTHLSITYDSFAFEEPSEDALAALDAARFLQLQELRISVPPVGLVPRILARISDDLRVVRFDELNLMFVSQSPYFRTYEFSMVPSADFKTITDPPNGLLSSIEEVILAHSTSGREITEAISAIVRAAPRTRILNSVLPGVPFLDANGNVQDVIYGWERSDSPTAAGHEVKLSLPALQELRIIANPDGSVFSILGGTIAEFIQSSIDMGARYELSILSLWNLHLVRSPNTDDGLVSFGLSDRVRMIDVRRHSGFATFH